MRLDKPTYLGISISQSKLQIARHDSRRVLKFAPNSAASSPKVLPSWLTSWAMRSKRKVVAVGLSGKEFSSDITSKLWLDEDIVPLVHTMPQNTANLSQTLAEHAQSRFDDQHIIQVRLGAHREVLVDDLITLEDHQTTASKEEFAQLLELAGELKGKNVIFISATPQGGGVALMRHAMMRLYRLLGVDAHWHVLKDRAEVFLVTKTKFHNVLQAVASPDVELTDADEEEYLNWSKTNADILRPAYTKADVVIIDDPQPAGLIPYIKADNPKAKLIYRSHIQIVADLADRLGTPQHKTWQFIWQFAKQADVFIAHPVKAFVPKSVPSSKLVYMPATGDPLDGLNKPLTKPQLAYYRNLFNDFLLKDGQAPLDFSRPYIAQVARFDPSKGIPDVLESYRSLRERMEKDGKQPPQLVITGFGSIDDPDGTVILDLTMAMLQQERFAHIAHDVKVARLPHVDQLLNMIMRECTVYVQLSHKEGYEEKVSTALMMGKPAVVYNAGGIPLQVVDGESGFVVEVGDTEGVANKLYQLLTDDKLYQKLCVGALDKFNRECRTIPNSSKWLYLANDLLRSGKVDTNKPAFKKLFATRSR